MNPRFSDPAVLAHLGVLQQIIGRMAGNSSNCKAWSITIASAILVVAVDKAAAPIAVVATAPAFLFFLLDTYYLTLEKMFRRSHDAYVTKIQTGQEQPSDLFAVTPIGDFWADWIVASRSFSIWPFYATLVLSIFGIASCYR